MCLAILKLAGKHIIKRRLREGFKKNSDGAGFMCVANNQLRIDKGYFTFRRFYKAFRDTERKYPDSNFVIHFRQATSGKTNIVSCHPFFIRKTVGFVHNGIFTKLGDETKSDTQQFNEQFLRHLPEDFMHNTESIKFVKELCGYFNKLIFLNSKNEYLIVNENEGQWLNDVWYSNIVEHTSIYGDDERDDWCSCTVCTGYYPVNELQTLDSGKFICKSCFEVASGNSYQKICHDCGRALDIYDDYSDCCPYCGADLIRVWT